MKNSVIKRLKGYALAVLSIFSKKKRVTAILSPTIETVASKPSVSTPFSLSNLQRSSTPVARLRDITAMLDQEAVELYGRGEDNPHGKRNPYVRD